jgi:hypothetical protein
MDLDATKRVTLWNFNLEGAIFIIYSLFCFSGRVFIFLPPIP